jgi:hypothetical protein
MMSKGRPDCTMLSNSGSIGCRPDNFFSWIRIYSLRVSSPASLVERERSVERCCVATLMWRFGNIMT